MHVSIKILKIGVMSISDVKEITDSDLEIAFLPANKCLARRITGTQSAGKKDTFADRDNPDCFTENWSTLLEFYEENSLFL